MENNPLITIVTVTYNAEAFLENTIQSIINQTYSNVEYIIIDGSSTDSTEEIIKQYKEHIDFYISEPDKGIYDAMNKGLKKANGEWINFLNAGDTFVNQNTLFLLSSYLEYNLDVVYGDRYVIDNKKDIKQYSKALGFNNIYKGMPCCHQSIFIKTTLHKKHPYNSIYKLAADYDMMLQLVQSNLKYKYIEIPICSYLLGGESIRHKIKYNSEALYILSCYLKDTQSLTNSSFFSFLQLLHNNPEEIPYFKDSSFNNKGFLEKLVKTETVAKTLQDKYKRIAIYGYGTFGQYFYTLLNQNTTLIIDKNISDDTINSPSKLTELKFDVIIICALGYEAEITHYLQKQFNIENHKIIKLDFSLENSKGYYI